MGSIKTCSSILLFEFKALAQRDTNTGESCYIHFHYSHLCISTILFHCVEEHQCPVCGHGRSCCTWPVSYMLSLPDLCCYFDLSHVVSQSFSTMLSVCSVHLPFCAFLVYREIFRNANPSYNKSHLHLSPNFCYDQHTNSYDGRLDRVISCR